MIPAETTPLISSDLVMRVNAITGLVKALPQEMLNRRLLLWQEKGLPMRWHELGKAVTLGRHPQNEIVLESLAISRRHARFERRADGWWVVDLNSRHGIRRNGRPVEGEARVHHGDWIELAGVGVGFLNDPIDPDS